MRMNGGGDACGLATSESIKSGKTVCVGLASPLNLSENLTYGTFPILTGLFGISQSSNKRFTGGRWWGEDFELFDMTILL